MPAAPEGYGPEDIAGSDITFSLDMQQQRMKMNVTTKFTDGLVHHRIVDFDMPVLLIGEVLQLTTTIGQMADLEESLDVAG